jgi:hypothetical protein
MVKDLRKTHKEKGSNISSPLSSTQDYLLCPCPTNEAIKPSTTSAENSFARNNFSRE